MALTKDIMHLLPPLIRSRTSACADVLPMIESIRRRHAKCPSPATFASWPAALVFLLCMTSCAKEIERESDVEQVEVERLTAAAQLENQVSSTQPLSSEQASDRARVKALLSRRDPAHDGWTTESIGEATGARLDSLLEAWTGSSLDVAYALCSKTVSCAFLRPKLQLAFEDENTRVWRSDEAKTDAVKHEGREAFAASLDELCSPLRAAQKVQLAFKVVGVETEGESPVRATTTAAMAVSGHSESERISQHSYWECDWIRNNAQPQGEWMLSAVRVRDFEEVRSSQAAPWLRDATQAVLGETSAWTEQLRYGLDHWGRHIERLHQSNLYLKWGVAIGDVNGDGLEDLYLCQSGGLPNRLFVQSKDGTARDTSKAAGVDIFDATTAAVFVDMDGDADADLALATHSGVFVFANDGIGRFSVRARLAMDDVDVNSMNAVDYDLDGDLDLYVTTAFASPATRRKNPQARFDYVDANDGGRNVLWRNDGSMGTSWNFSDATAACGLDVNNRRYSLASTWVDYDSDGDSDLYVANDYGQNSLYRNDGGKFVDVAADLGVVDSGSGMSASWGDYDRDGRPDLYVANMFSSAGRRITTQSGFRADDSGEHRALYRQFARGNSLFHQRESGRFEERAHAAGVELGRWAWGSVFCDLNGDGWQDLVVANGYVTTADSGDS